MLISGRTKIFGIFGYPVEHTFSPRMHNAGFTKLGIDACYVPFSVHPDRLAEAVKAVLPLGLRGLNITVPHKEKVMPFLDDLSEEAGLIGAVNTIEAREGRLIGHNTDGRGFIRSLQELAKFDPRGKRFLIIGAGGAGRAVGFSLAISGVRRIFLRDMDAQKAGMLVNDIRDKTGVIVEMVPEEEIEASAAEADCLINATPLGLKGSDLLPIRKEFIQRKHLVYDLVYNPPETRLLRAAKARGARGLGGLGMLLYQGIIAFEIWTGKKAPVRVMRSALSRQISERS